MRLEFKLIFFFFVDYEKNILWIHKELFQWNYRNLRVDNPYLKFFLHKLRPEFLHYLVKYGMVFKPSRYDNFNFQEPLLVPRPSFEGSHSPFYDIFSREKSLPKTCTTYLTFLFTCRLFYHIWDNLFSDPTTSLTPISDDVLFELASSLTRNQTTLRRRILIRGADREAGRDSRPVCSPNRYAL